MKYLLAIQEASHKTFLQVIFSCLNSLVPKFVLRGPKVVRGSFFGAILSRITSPFSTRAKSTAACGQFDSLLKTNFYINDQFVCLNPEQMLGCTNTICLYGPIEISCTIPSGSLCPPSCVQSYTLCVLICCICLLCDWWFCLCHHITYIFFFVASYLFLFWYDWFL